MIHTFCSKVSRQSVKRPSVGRSGHEPLATLNALTLHAHQGESYLGLILARTHWPVSQPKPMQILVADNVSADF